MIFLSVVSIVVSCTMLKIELEMSYAVTGQLTKARFLDQIELVKKK